MSTIRPAGSLVGLAGLACLFGCPPLPPEPISVVLVNETALDVAPRLHVSATAAGADGLFVAENRVKKISDRPFPELRARESVVLAFPCEDVASLGVSGSILFDALALTVELAPDQIVLAPPGDVECGGAVRFVFYQDAGGFRVRWERPE